jgi:DNA-binding MarR family transcriptional regulator
MAIASLQAQKQLDLTALRNTPGFMIRLLQLKIFDGFYETFARLGLTPATYAILLLVRDNPGIAPSNVATLLRLQLPNLTKILRELEDAALVQRSRSQIDRRAIEITLSSKGEKVIKDAVRLTGPFDRRMFASLSEAEQSTLLGLLNKVALF